MSTAIYWLSNDLRLSDNQALTQALLREPTLSFVYCLDPALFKPSQYMSQPLGKFRYRFLVDALVSLDVRLKAHGQYLNVYYQRPHRLFERLHREAGVSRVYHSVNAGFNEQAVIRSAMHALPDLEFIGFETHTLFASSALPCTIEQLPDTFSKFRKQIEKSDCSVPPDIAAPLDLGRPGLPPQPWDLPSVEALPVNIGYGFQGGELAGLAHLAHYFSTQAPQCYKQTRNALSGMDQSTKFSPWLALGCISPRQVVRHLRCHEAEQGANESTGWIFFELLWREYFQWYAHKHQRALFRFRGIRPKAPLTSFYNERFQRWCNGNTPYPIVNACMHELNQTGYLSNRGRQLIASCFVHELGLDWRYGAAYFEQQLIDYDVASNWGNWQYLAGVGADPRGSRQFNLVKQVERYDPKGDYIKQWRGQASVYLDSTDAVGWPIGGDG